MPATDPDPPAADVTFVHGATYVHDPSIDGATFGPDACVTCVCSDADPEKHPPPGDVPPDEPHVVG